MPRTPRPIDNRAQLVVLVSIAAETSMVEKLFYFLQGTISIRTGWVMLDSWSAFLFVQVHLYIHTSIQALAIWQMLVKSLAQSAGISM